MMSVCGLYCLTYDSNKKRYTRSYLRLIIIIIFCLFYCVEFLWIILLIHGLHYTAALFMIAQAICTSYLVYISCDILVYWKYKLAYLNETIRCYTRQSGSLNGLMKDIIWFLYYIFILCSYLVIHKEVHAFELYASFHGATFNHLLPCFIEYEYSCLMKPLLSCKLIANTALENGIKAKQNINSYEQFIDNVEKRHRLSILFDKVRLLAFREKY